LLGVNQFFADLIAATRTASGADACRRLVRWWSTDETAAAFAGRIHPDSHGLLQVGQQPCEADDRAESETGAGRAGSAVGFWLEYDTGTESLHRLVAKLDAYARLQQAGGPVYPVLFWLPGIRREVHLHDLLASTRPRDVTVAAATHTDASNSTRP
jgi:hypothetical protein